MPGFGRQMLDQWCLDPAVTYLNHGTVGATPRRVLAAQRALQDSIERQPSAFLLRELSGSVGSTPRAKTLMRAAADAVGGFVGARGDDVVFVDNATAGANAVLGSLDLGPGDEILVTDHGYGAVSNAAAYAARRRGAAVRTVTLPHPTAEPRQLVDAIVAAVGPRTRVAIVDHVTSGSAMVMPLAEIAAALRARGVAVLADGAHAPGALALEIPALGVDWYTANLHKWAWAPRSCGFLWVAPGRSATLHPPVISWGLDQGMTAEFDWMGTRDPTPWLTAPEAIAMLRDLDPRAVREYNRALALEAGRRLREGLGAEAACSEPMIGTMITLALPRHYGSTDAEALALRNALLFEDHIEVQLHAHDGRLWVRVSAQIYNDEQDVDRLVGALRKRGA